VTGGTVPGGDGRFPGYDVVAESERWDAVTTGVVLRRLGPPPKLRFFSVDEEATARPLLDRLLAQDDDPRIPVFAMIDSRLAENETDGWRYDDMPEDADAWKQSLHLLDEEAVAKKGTQFCDLSTAAQREVLEAVRTSDRLGPLPAARVWSLWMRYACAAFYSHPWAWNEIGFGGPAYPRGYANLGLDAREHWEVGEADARDPVPWADRVEAARRRHETDADRR
jgi:hypothetical protein